MKIKMKVDVKAKANENGSVVMVYKAGQVYNMEAEWQMKQATKFMNNGKADKASNVSKTTKVVEDMEKKTTKAKKSILKKVFGKKKK